MKLFNRIQSIGWFCLAGSFLCCWGIQGNQNDPSESNWLMRIGPESALDKETAAFQLVGPDARLQWITEVRPSNEGSWKDITREVQFEVSDPTVLKISKTGYLEPLRDGQVTVQVRWNPGSEERAASQEALVQISGIANPPSINFPNEIVPLLTKNGCNGGGCHGKSEGQNGFKLSLLGFEPTEDYDHIVREARGRRIFPAAPENSLFLRKATGELPHGGGSRIEKDSHAYRAIVRWIEQGMPYGSESDPVVERIEVYPQSVTLNRGSSVQISTLAYYTDGSVRDITRIAQYESNQPELANCDISGWITAHQQTGVVSVMARYQDHVGVFRAMVPLGAPMDVPFEIRNQVDEHIYVQLKKLGLPPSALADDLTFLRRAAFDIAGRSPTDQETIAFMNSPAPDKRERWINTLLEDPGYADYFANKWNAILRNKRSKPSYSVGNFQFYSWLRSNLDENVPFDQWIEQLITASGDVRKNPPVNWYRSVRSREERMQDVAQAFMGIRLQCAQCHHHPFEKWSQQDYYGFAAFFSQVGTKNGVQPDEDWIYHRPGKARAQNPKTKRQESPTPLGETPLDIEASTDPRQALADWMTSRENPFFARMLVNRYWKHFFGKGLVEPEDDMRTTNPATHPELLDDLAEYFIESGYDLKALVRLLCNSSTYQLSAIPNAHNAADQQSFSKMYPRRLPAESLLDTIDTITGVPTQYPNAPSGIKAIQLPDDSFNQSSYFLTVFGRPEMDSACECERVGDANLAQSLHLLNSKTLHEKLTSKSGWAHELAHAESWDPELALQLIYRKTLSRNPTSEELQTGLKYLTGPETQEARQAAIEDILWALFNTREFLFNH